MMKHLLSYSLGGLILVGCSSLPKLPEIEALGTKQAQQNYYYCKDCPKPTELKKQVYQPLVPDEPLEAESAPVIQQPIITPTKLPNPEITNKKQRSAQLEDLKNKKPTTIKSKSKKTKNKFNNNHKKKPKQCIQWS